MNFSSLIASLLLAVILASHPTFNHAVNSFGKTHMNYSDNSPTHGVLTDQFSQTTSCYTDSYGTVCESYPQSNLPGDFKDGGWYEEDEGFADSDGYDEKLFA